MARVAVTASDDSSTVLSRAASGHVRVEAVSGVSPRLGDAYALLEIQARRELRYIRVIAQNADLSDLALDRIDFSLEIVGRALDARRPTAENMRLQVKP